MTLLYFFMTDLLAQQDVNLLKKLLEGEEQSAFDETESVTYEDVKKLRAAQFLKENGKDNNHLIRNEVKAVEIVKMTFEGLIKLFKGFSNLRFSVAFKQK